MNSPDRRQADAHLAALCDRVTSVEQAQTALAADVKKNTELTMTIERNTSVIVEAWRALEGGFKVLRVLGRVAKYLGYIAAAATAVWALVKGLRP